MLQYHLEGGMNMLSFRNDYSEGCIPEILELLQKTNGTKYDGYGLDIECKKAKEMIQAKMPDTNADIHFLVGGTQTNLTIIKAALRSYEAVIACDSGHIALHETGAIEATGHKVITVSNTNGKITSSEVKKAYDAHMLTYEHMVYPKMVYISNATEFGTVYSLHELKDLRNICDQLGMYLMMDGARLGVALMSGVDYTLNDVAKYCDVFTIGGTKNGALFGEAVVIVNPELKKNFRFVMKQTGAMLAKGWLLGLQFQALFEKDTLFMYADYEIRLAQLIQKKLHELRYPLFMKSETNQVFPLVTSEQFEFLSKYIDFEVWEKRDNFYVIRFATGFSTKKEDIDQLFVYLKEAAELKKEES